MQNRAALEANFDQGNVSRLFVASCSQATFAFDDAEPFENRPAERPENVSITPRC